MLSPSHRAILLVMVTVPVAIVAGVTPVPAATPPVDDTTTPDPGQHPSGTDAPAPQTSTPVDPPTDDERNESAPTDPQEPPAETIDPVTAIESTWLEDGTMVLVIRSDVPQLVTLTDAGAVWGGGEIPQRSLTLQAGRNRVSIPVTEVDGRVGVTIATQRVLHGTTLTTGTTLLPGPFGRDDVQIAAIAGAFAGVGVTALIAFRRVTGTTSTPERVL
ncbi:hypothetical protein [Halanaeroarchaeum sulfurireducens]|uniref:hypothetical protein n=1 Tax=Halanaeroarchaeum sulfurireducens TaxID=1604004 RepID=UPI00118764AA|nr:hypothetical protein [Halanaeroarchaeum sulfurireducens]